MLGKKVLESVIELKLAPFLSINYNCLFLMRWMQVEAHTVDWCEIVCHSSSCGFQCVTCQEEHRGYVTCVYDSNKDPSSCANSNRSIHSVQIHNNEYLR